MTRVDEHREAQRVAEQRRVEDGQKARREKASDEFRKVVSQQQQSARSAATQQAQARQKGEAQAQAGVKSSASAALLARQGIQSRAFASALQEGGERSVEKARVEGKGRREEIVEERRRADDPGARARAGQDPLAEIAGDERREHGGLGSGAEDGGAMDMSGQQQPGMSGRVDGAPAQETAGPHAPRLSPEIVQQLVARVFAGVTPEGLSQLTIQLNDGVLGGARLDVTGKDGKITCTFHTADENVARLVKASEGALARAFARKGLRLDRLEVVKG